MTDAQFPFYMREKIISFCITCKNRFDQIRRTLPRNLKDNYRHKSIIEFTLIDFNSSDGLKEWIIANFKKEINQQYLKYYHTKELVHWHMSVAKNTAHIYGSGELLVNLDCDNYTGRNGGYFLLNSFNKYHYPIVIHQFSGNQLDGSCGRISVRREDFHKIGGYDESFAPVGYDDWDLIMRLVQGTGLEYKNIKNINFNKSIDNSKELSVRYCDSQMNVQDMDSHNRIISSNNLVNRKIIANMGIYGIRRNVYNHKGLEINPSTVP
jgi:hypothetical protein